MAKQPINYLKEYDKQIEEGEIMYDSVMKLDLDKYKDIRKYDVSFVIFPDGRTILVNSGSHSSTIVEYAKKYYPEIEKEFKPLLDKQLESWDDEDVDQDTKEYYSNMIVLTGDFISRRLGIVLIHNNEFLFSDVNTTKEQEYALDKLDEMFDIVWL